MTVITKSSVTLQTYLGAVGGRLVGEFVGGRVVGLIGGGVGVLVHFWSISLEVANNVHDEAK